MVLAFPREKGAMDGGQGPENSAAELGARKKESFEGTPFPWPDNLVH